MDPSMQWFFEKRAEAVCKVLGRNRINAEYIADPTQVAAKVMAMIPDGATVATGGSMTMHQTGVMAALESGDRFEFINRWEKGIEPAEMKSRLKRGLTADVFIAGVNAVTEQGELVFVDASCTRVAPVLFGPEKVILLTGCNKIVPDLAHAQQRIRHFVAPTNAKRLGRKTPCAEDGRCHDCASPDRICNATVVIHKQMFKDRMQVFFIGSSLGL